MARAQSLWPRVAAGFVSAGVCGGCATFLSDPFDLERERVAPLVSAGGAEGNPAGSVTGSAGTAGAPAVTTTGQAGTPASMPSAAPIDDGEVPFEEPVQPDAGEMETEPAEGGAGGAGGTAGAGGGGGNAAGGAAGCSDEEACTEIEFILTPVDSDGLYGDDVDLAITVDDSLTSSITAQAPEAWIEYELDQRGALTRSQVATGIGEAGEFPSWQLLYFDGSDFVEAVAPTTGIDIGYSESDIDGFVTDRVRFVFSVLDSGGGRGGGFQGAGPDVEEVKLFGFAEP